MKKTIAIFVILVMLAALGACAPGTSAPAAPAAPPPAAAPGATPAVGVDAADDGLVWGLAPFAERQNLRIGFFTGSPLSYPFLFAYNLGVFDALNIDVSFTHFTGGPAMMEANAEWDIASCGLGGMVNGLFGFDFNLVTFNDYEDNIAIFVREGSPLAENKNDPEVWRGATAVYPAGTTAQAVLVNHLNNMGLTLADIESINMDNASSLTAFNGGTADILACWNVIALAAEDFGHVRVTDSGQLGFTAPCGTFAQQEMLNDRFDLLVVATIVFHKATEWVYESEANMLQAIEWFYAHCESEGFLISRDVADRTMRWFRGPTVDEWIQIFTEYTGPDVAGLYTARDLLQAEHDLLVGLDFFIGEGRFSNEDRARYLTDRRVDSRVAIAARELLGR